MFIRLTNGIPETYTIGQLRRDNPQTSFPKDIPADMLASYDVYPVKRVPAPEYDSLTQNLVYAGIFEIGGVWTQVWDVVSASDSEIEQRKTDQIESIKQQRAEAYTEETDPLFFKAQRGEATIEEWSAKIEEIRNRYPYPEE